MTGFGFDDRATRASVAIALGALLAIAGCDNGDGDMDAGTDAGEDMVDAGGEMDAGEDMMDAGGDEDAGGGDDAGPGDAGAEDGGPGDGGSCSPERTWMECTDGVDNDCDGDTDTDDGCSVCPPVAASEAGAEDTAAFCGDGIDNDCDGFVDCADFDCTDVVAPCAAEETDALCTDGIDNDGDGRVDCLQRSCAATASCRPATMTSDEADATLCANGLDDDYDGFTDCDDDSCDGVGTCGNEDADAVCMDMSDNDGDGFVDCRDNSCNGVTYCMGEESDAACTDGVDNDHDGWIDCRDLDCIDLAVCRDPEMACDDGVDDDLDGNADCRDEDCAAACAADPCSDTNWFGTCAAPEECAMGVCARPLSSYTFPTTPPVLLITELMPNPDGISDSDGEYVEVTNVSSDTVNVMGLVASDSTTSTTTVDEMRVLAPDETVVFIADADSTVNGGITDGVDVSFSLNQGGDDAVISFGGTDIHRVTYPGTGSDLNNVGTGAAGGQSFNLDQSFIDGTTTTATWCLTPADAANEYTGGTDANYGTPGATNVVCP